MKSCMMLLVTLGAAVLVRAMPTDPPIEFTSTTLRPLDPNHVPSEACRDMAPVHGNCTASDKSPPYSVAVSQLVVTQGNAIQVTLAGNGAEVFKGIYVQARQNDIPVGRFVTDNPKLFVSDCPPGHQNALTYASRTDALNILQVTWIAPADITGEVVFRTTFVKTFCDFWLGVVSPTVKIEERNK